MTGRATYPDLSRYSFRIPSLVALLLAVSVQTARAYGPEGHLIAGIVAAEQLCPRAADTVSRLGDGETLGEIGLWADRIRGIERYADSAPWHYMNIATGESFDDYAHPPEGDVLWAIDRFSVQLADRSQSNAMRAEALKFLVHFIVDIHQPLHVGLASDRGGNAIELRYNGERTNLHRFWDTHAIEWTGLPVGDYARRLSSDSETGEPVELDPLVWAEESRALRARVYDFGRAGQEPSRSYKDFAAETTIERLRLASRRLAGTLNRLLCE